MAATNTLRDWLWLTQAPGVSDEAVRRLLTALGNATAIHEAGPGAWRAITHADVAAALGARRPDTWFARCDATQAWLEAAPQTRGVLSLSDPAYPMALRQIPDAPPLLFAEGALSCLQGPCVAMVGSRRASAQGLELAHEFAAGLSAAGLTVVSGLAQGIDGAAHRGALRGAGKTVAVVGTGLDRVYPRAHQTLSVQVAHEGLMLSEYLPGTPPLAAHFPRRNRIIAGLSLGTLVVEAAPQSGSLITARLASEYGREVFAIPGSVRSEQSAGCHQLIRDGAQLVTSVKDLLETLLPMAAAQFGAVLAAPVAAPTHSSGAACDAPASENVVLNALGGDPLTLDQLAARTGLSADRLQIELLTLELEGRVARQPGGLFQRMGRC